MKLNKKFIKQVLEKIFLLLIFPGIIFAFLEGAIRISGIDVDSISNKRFGINLPGWLISNEEWVFATKFRQDEKGWEMDDSRIDWQKNYRKDRFVEYRLQPDIDSYCVNDFNKLEVANNLRFHVVTNSKGYRTAEFSEKKPFNTFRIISLGDSSTFGWGVDNDKTFSAKLQTLLNSEQRFQALNFEVINMGIPGYTTEHGVRLLDKEVSNLDPDMLIVSYGVNDARISLNSISERLKKEACAIAWVREQLEKLYIFKLLRKLIFQVYDPFSKDINKQRPHTKPNVDSDSYQKNLKTFIDFMKKRNRFIILLGICAPESYRTPMKIVASQYDVPYADAFDLFDAKIEDIKSGKIFTEEMALYKSVYGENQLRNVRSRYVTSDGCHPHIIGHQIIADELANIILHNLH
ncbi:MAG: hypothetical protein A2161_18625 [Candidatus Schekmanbacteria bacterium RBG_13_48_7]|uniref:SGNH hydrolase-type esterase domain-containing protein n=1 Tax=Candidatus Schekmanbacteria bacterium RBG_13_48_7 TaxID=1817878 RepID=A0A1F7RJX3_9BACT|nr:MAG: hypothetical protein A2161_18625 [Candidatus Schekmanbacteria bacterium RBG_13_48_7]